jgi:hypothetical protein
MEADNPREQKHKRDRGSEYEDEEDDEVEVDPRRRTLKISFDGLKPDPANERFTQVEMDHFLEHNKVWAVACNMDIKERTCRRSSLKELFRHPSEASST